MQKVNLVCVGKLKEKFFADAVAEYVKRLGAFCVFRIAELPEKRTLAEEGELIVKELRGYVFVLAVEGGVNEERNEGWRARREHLSKNFTTDMKEIIEVKA